MRKTVKRLTVLLLAVILCLSLPITAMAENGGAVPGESGQTTEMPTATETMSGVGTVTGVGIITMGTGT